MEWDFMLMAILMVPNVVLQMIQVFSNRNGAPFWSFVFSLIMNCGYGLLISGHFLVGGILVGFGAVCFILPFSLSCPQSFEGNHVITRDIMSKPVDNVEFHRVLQMARAEFPVITITCIAYHTRRVRHPDGHGRAHISNERHNTWHCTRVIDYGSWEERGNPIEITGLDILHCHIDPTFVCSPSQEKVIETQRAELRKEGYRHDQSVEIRVCYGVPQVQNAVVGYLGSEMPKSMKFYHSCIGRILYFFFWAIGYQAAFETFYAQLGERCSLGLKKYVSAGTELRATEYAPDEVGAETTFKFTVEPAPVPETYLFQDGGISYYNPYAYNVLATGYQMPVLPQPEMGPMGGQQPEFPQQPPPPGYQPGPQPPAYPQAQMQQYQSPPNQIPQYQQQPIGQPTSYPPPGYVPSQNQQYQQPPAAGFQPPQGMPMPQPPVTQAPYTSLQPIQPEDNRPQI